MNIRIGRDKIFLLSFFFIVIFAGSALLMIPGMYRPGGLAYIDALFTSTSAVCVTGLISVDTADYTMAGQIVIMLLIQTGGLGIITFATLYIAIPRRKISIINQGIISDFSLSEIEYRPKAIIRSILIYTFFCELLGAAVFHTRFGPMGYPIFYSLFHAVSAFCNAGFSTFSTNLEAFVKDPVVNFNTMSLIVIGGIGFIVMRDVRKRSLGLKTHLSYHSKIVLKTTAALILGGALGFFLLESSHSMAGLTFPQKIMASLFQSVTPRTAGFDTIAQHRMTQGSSMLTMILMFIGASPASTGGGIKTTTFFLILATAFGYKDSSDVIRYQRRSVAPQTVYKAVGIVVKGIFIVLFASLMVMVSEAAAGNELSLVDAMFEVISAFGTVGLSRGITFSLHPAAKIVLIATMYTGRVGLFAFALPKSSRDLGGYAHLPGADVLIG